MRIMIRGKSGACQAGGLAALPLANPVGEVGEGELSGSGTHLSYGAVPVRTTVPACGMVAQV